MRVRSNEHFNDLGSRLLQNSEGHVSLMLIDISRQIRVSCAPLTFTKCLLSLELLVHACSLRIPRRNVEQYPLRLPMSTVEPRQLRTRLQMSRNQRNHGINGLAIGNWICFMPHSYSLIRIRCVPWFPKPKNTIFWTANRHTYDATVTLKKTKIKRI